MDPLATKGPGVALSAWYFTAAENKSAGPVSFMILIGLVLLLVARQLSRSKDGLAELLDEPDRPMRRRARRRQD